MQTLANRRQFLALSSAALAAAARPFGAIAAERGFKLGVASYSLRRFTRPQAIQMLKQMEVRHVSIKDYHLPLTSTPEEIRAARAEFDAAGLTTLSCGMIKFMEDDERDMRAKFEYAKLAGFPMIVCGPTRVTLPKLEKFVKEYDIRIAVHNHGPEDPHFPTPQSALPILAGMDPRCGLCVDCGHTAQTGADVVAAIREAGARVLDVHLKDLRDIRNPNSWCDVGEGMMPVAAIFRELRRMDYRGGVMLEYEIHENDPMAGMQKSLAYMRGSAAALEG